MKIMIAQRMPRNRPELRWASLVLLCCCLPSPAGRATGVAGPLPSSTSRLISIRLVPENPTLYGKNTAQRFVVLGKDANGLERDLTLDSQFTVSNPQAAKVDRTGTVAALTDGKVVLTARAAGHVTKTLIQIKGSQTAIPFSFSRDIAGIFTKQGCNGSACHGSVKGRGGFKLSLYGLYPQEDYKWIVEGGGFQVLRPEPKEPKMPRVNVKDPEKSLLLLKPTFSLPHGGGLRFPVKSDDYETILNWVRSGAPFGDTWHVDRIEIFPKELYLDRQGKQQLLVTAVLSDGTRKDITGDVSYASNNGQIAEVSPAGLVSAVGPGETAVMVRAAGQEVFANVGVIAKELSNYPTPKPRNYIDQIVDSKLQKLNIVPSSRSTDAEFLRRVCLDLTGTLPPSDRAREFLASKDPEKRDKLIEILLNSPEYVDYWTFSLSDVFRVESAASSNAALYQEWLRESISQNKPYDRLARERVSAQGYDGPSTHFTALGAPQVMMAEEVRVFLGVRLDCAQCHNHPREVWSQNQFWGMTAFFGHMSKINPESPSKNPVVIEDPNGFGIFGEGAKVTNPRTKKEVIPIFLDGTPLPQNGGSDLRMALAEWMTSHKNPYFARAAVNRFWRCFFGRGIVEPVDDFRSSNPPTDPDLLDALSRDFVDHGYDLKHLFRVIVQSNTYQESGVTNDTNKDDNISYSHATPRALDAEVLLDAIIQLAGANKDLQTSRAITWTDDGGSQFLKVYGRPDRMTVPERDMKPNLTQALDQVAGSTYTSLLSKSGGSLDRLVQGGASDAQIIEELYLSALSRYPTSEEQNGLQRLIHQGPSRRDDLENLLWALVNSEEFVHNY